MPELTADTLLDEAALLLAENLRRLREAMKTDEEKFNERHSAQAQRLARSAAALDAERRKRGDAFEEAAKKTTPEQRADAAEVWLIRLPYDDLKPRVERLIKKLKEKK